MKSHLLQAFATQAIVARDAAVAIRSDDFDMSISGEPVQLTVFNSPNKAEQIHPALLREVRGTARGVGGCIVASACGCMPGLQTTLLYFFLKLGSY